MKWLIYDLQGMVSVENVTVISISTIEELKGIIQRGSEKRHTAETEMNEESSRSHLILSVVIESTNLQTQSIARGKVSVDMNIHIVQLFLVKCKEVNTHYLYLST